jgi:hypothetical protein
MSEAEKFKAAEACLKLLASRLNRAADRLHPVKEKHLERVRAAVREQWAAKQNKIKRHAAKSSQQASAMQKKSKSQSKDYGHSH